MKLKVFPVFKIITLIQNALQKNDTVMIFDIIVDSTTLKLVLEEKHDFLNRSHRQICNLCGSLPM